MWKMFLYNMWVILGSMYICVFGCFIWTFFYGWLQTFLWFIFAKLKRGHTHFRVKWQCQIFAENLVRFSALITDFCFYTFCYFFRGKQISNSKIYDNVQFYYWNYYLLNCAIIIFEVPKHIFTCTNFNVNCLDKHYFCCSL